MEQLQAENSAVGGLSDLTAWLGFPPVLDACCGPKGMWFDKQTILRSTWISGAKPGKMK